jgi:hypothetical protein
MMIIIMIFLYSYLCYLFSYKGYGLCCRALNFFFAVAGDQLTWSTVPFWAVFNACVEELEYRGVLMTGIL